MSPSTASQKALRRIPWAVFSRTKRWSREIFTGASRVRDSRFCGLKWWSTRAPGAIASGWSWLKAKLKYMSSPRL